MNFKKYFQKNLFGAFFIFLTLILSSCSSSGEYDAFAQCLTDSNVVMYGTEWCSHCQNQKKTFGSSFKLVTFIDCDRNKLACESVSVDDYPTWVINDQNYAGERSLYELSQLSGCELYTEELEITE